MYFAKPWPKYFEYDRKGELVLFKFVKYDAGWMTGFDEKSKRRVDLYSWGYQYADGGYPKVADLKYIYYQNGAGGLNAIPYDKELFGV